MFLQQLVIDLHASLSALKSAITDFFLHSEPTKQCKYMTLTW